jgi:hypothetical protein
MSKKSKRLRNRCFIEDNDEENSNDNDKYYPSIRNNTQQTIEHYQNTIEERDVLISDLRDEIKELKSKIYDLTEEKNASKNSLINPFLSTSSLSSFPSSSSSTHNAKKYCQLCGEKNDIFNSFCTKCYSDFNINPFR